VLVQTESITTNASWGIYTYCFTKTHISFPHTFMGIDGIHNVYCVEKNGIFAVVSNISLKEYNEESLNKNMTDVIWLSTRAKRHNEIIDFVMIHARNYSENHAYGNMSDFANNNIEETSYNEITYLQGTDSFKEKYYIPLVPLRFCTIYKDYESLFNSIIPHKEMIISFLDYTSDKAEWSVKSFCDKTTFINSCNKMQSNENFEHKSLLPGESYLMAKKIRKINEEIINAEIQKTLKDIYHSLSQYTDSHKLLRCIDKSIHGESQDMLMNAAFLVKWQALNDFKYSVDIWANEYKNKGLIFKINGPWPPYNFCPQLY